MVEKELEQTLVDLLRTAEKDRSLLRSVGISSSTSAVSSLYDLIGENPFDLFQDTSDWNQAPTFMVDVAYGITPDVVVRSKLSKQNRIYIEVKLHEEIRGEEALSQVTRQFLHLLGTTECNPKGAADIRRALLLAAPSAWFDKQKNGSKWRYFLDHYTDLAKISKIDITLGEIRLDGEF